MADTNDQVDRAVPLVAVQNAFAAYRGRYWVAGGWAVDLHVGRIRRVHSDVDVLILARDLEHFDAVFGAGGITLHDHQTGTDTAWAFPQDVIPGRHVFRFADAIDPLAIEVVIGLADGEDWLFHRGRTTRRPLAAMTHVSPGGVPYLGPEVVLMFKAREPRPKDEEDFADLQPLLTREQASWLAPRLAPPGDTDHPWLSGLSGRN